jgi:hypothetical protein
LVAVNSLWPSFSSWLFQKMVPSSISGSRVTSGSRSNIQHIKMGNAIFLIKQDLLFQGKKKVLQCFEISKLIQISLF